MHHILFLTKIITYSKIYDQSHGEKQNLNQNLQFLRDLLIIFLILEILPPFNYFVKYLTIIITLFARNTNYIRNLLINV